MVHLIVKKSEFYFREIVLTFGFEQLPLLLNLQHLGVLFNTVPLSDDITVQSQMIHQLVMSSNIGGGKDKSAQITQQQIQQIQAILAQPTNQQAINNILNFHIPVPKSGYASFSPLIRKPIWERLALRLKLAQPEIIINSNPTTTLQPRRHT
eukprot:UN04373